MENSDERLGRRLVLLVLADHAKKDGTNAWPSIDTIAHEARLSRAQVIRCLNELKEANAITERGTSRSGTKVYDVVMGSHIATGGGRISATEGGRRMRPEPSLEDQPSEVLTAAPKNGKVKNEVWEGLEYVFGEHTTPSARRELGKVCRDLNAVGATRDQIIARASAWPAHFDTATLTPHALERHWDALSRKPLRRSR
jgi:Helix-turn-helix domain